MRSLEDVTVNRRFFKVIALLVRKPGKFQDRLARSLVESNALLGDFVEVVFVRYLIMHPTERDGKQQHKSQGDAHASGADHLVERSVESGKRMTADTVGRRAAVESPIR